MLINLIDIDSDYRMVFYYSYVILGVDFIMSKLA